MDSSPPPSPSPRLTLTLQSSNLILRFIPALLSSLFHFHTLPPLHPSIPPPSALSLSLCQPVCFLDLSGLWLGHRVPVNTDPDSTCEAAASKCSLTCFSHDLTERGAAPPGGRRTNSMPFLVLTNVYFHHIQNSVVIKSSVFYQQ